ncbi:hypothetical protein BDQ94DRAFT_143210 [Aspergillus welwitschiae]|uniref:Uncharacterized protein n=1 Tax=Aspergillus welwitschiae TaxID=1341132 RepID=A0A3F3Q3B0_9EURO|nr:hypothetical protein BDQ94DRAFT_143210 [Aspergillus welwitschiae]RDH33497.1 hypothetical protein BDQ94DRAFT_143210 [Aspergillus welwitschiae]
MAMCPCLSRCVRSVCSVYRSDRRRENQSKPPIHMIRKVVPMFSWRRVSFNFLPPARIDRTGLHGSSSCRLAVGTYFLLNYESRFMHMQGLELQDKILDENFFSFLLS